MRIKIKRLLIIVLFFTILIIVFNSNNLISKANTSNSHNIFFNYIYKSGTDKSINNALTIKEDNVLKTKNLICGADKSCLISFKNLSDILVDKNNNIISESKQICLEVVSEFDTHQLQIINEVDEIIASSNEKYIITNLDVGLYTIKYTGLVNWDEQQNLSIIPRKAQIVCTFNLRIIETQIYGKLIKSDSNNSYYFTWENDSWTALLDGYNYTKNKPIIEEGDHLIELTNGYKVAKYNFNIDHYYVENAYEESTCSVNGYIKYICNQCGDEYIESLPLKEHEFSLSIESPTCTDFGHNIYSCVLCGFTKELVNGSYPSGHVYTVQIIKEPTCVEEGLLKSICDICGFTSEKVIAANGHNYHITDIQTLNKITIRTYTCSKCGYSYKQEIGNQYEEISNYVEYLFIQYSPYMWWFFLLVTGIWSIIIGVMIAIAQKNEEKEKAKKMIINYVIGLVVIAVILVACPYLIRGIAALVT